MNQLIIDAIDSAESPDTMFSTLLSDPYIIRMAAIKDIQTNTTGYIDKLVNMGVDIRCINDRGQNALHALSFLIRENCWVMDNDGTGMNYRRDLQDYLLLMKASMYLINKHGLDPILEDDDEDTAVDIADCPEYTNHVSKILLLPRLNRTVGRPEVVKKILKDLYN